MLLIISLKNETNLFYLNDYLNQYISTVTENTFYLLANQTYTLTDTDISFSLDCDLFCYKCRHANKWHLEAAYYDSHLASGAFNTTIYKTSSYQFIQAILPEPKKNRVIKVSTYYTTFDALNEKLQALHTELTSEKEFNQLVHNGGKASIITTSSGSFGTKIQTTFVMKQYAGVALEECFFAQLDIHTRLQLCRAILLAYQKQIESKKLVHLDLKPANMLYNPAASSWEEAITIIDFNNSALADVVAKIRAVTHEYASLEHYIDEPQLMHIGIDIFSLGRVLGVILQAPTLIAKNYSFPSTTLLVSQYQYADLPQALGELKPEQRSTLQSALAQTTCKNIQERISIENLLRIFTHVLNEQNTLHTTSLFAIPQPLAKPAESSEFEVCSELISAPQTSGNSEDDRELITQPLHLLALNAS